MPWYVTIPPLFIDSCWAIRGLRGRGSTSNPTWVLLSLNPLFGAPLLPNPGYTTVYDPGRSHIPNSISIGSSVLAQTHRHTPRYIGSNRPHASVNCVHAMRPEDRASCSEKSKLIVMRSSNDIKPITQIYIMTQHYTSVIWHMACNSTQLKSQATLGYI